MKTRMVSPGSTMGLSALASSLMLSTCTPCSWATFLQNEDPHGLARQHDGLERIGQFVDVEHLHAMQLGDLVQIEVVGDDLRVVDLGQLDQLHVHLADMREIVLDDLDVEVGHLLDALQDVEPAASAIALHG